MKVLITGATGLVGKEIMHYCHLHGISIHYLTTSKEKIVQHPNRKGFYWNPKLQVIDSACFEGVDTIINLAGATIAKRWTNAYKQEILDSRIESLQLLKTALQSTSHTVTQLISASAIGIYPDSQTNYYDESNTDTASGFLGNVVKAWEAAATDFESFGIKVAKVRIGLVLSATQGALPQMVHPIRYGFGAAFGTGMQWQSWIHITDLAHLFMHILKHRLTGVYNAVAPNPLSNKEFTKVVAKAVNRPLWLPNIPRFIMRFILGDMHTLLFESQRVSSKQIEDAGFDFEYHHLQLALEDLYPDTKHL